MSVETLTNRQPPLACDGSTILFALTVPYFNESEITVTLKEIATGEETTLDINVDFEIPGVGDEDYGKIRLIGDYAATPPSSDYALYIIRILPLNQLMDLIPGAAFNPALNEASFDRLVMICQQLADALNRAAIAKTTSGLSGLVLPVEAEKYIMGNEAGTNLVAVAGTPPTSEWLYGAGAPAAGLGTNSDYYLNTTNGDIYQKVAGSWGAPIANIKGPQGDQGTGDMNNPMTAAADLIVGGTAGAPARLAKGSPLQIVRMNEAGSAQEYATLPINWTLIPAANYTAAPLSTSEITFGVDMTAVIPVGVGLRYTIGGTEYFGQVIALAANKMTIRGISLAGAISNLQWGGFIFDPLVVINSYYEDADDADVLWSDCDIRWPWAAKKSYMVGFDFLSKIHDQGANHGKATFLVDSHDVCTDADGLTLAADDTVYQTGINISATYYGILFGKLIKIAVKKGTNGDAWSLNGKPIILIP